MSDTTYWLGLAVASAMIIGFVLCFLENKAARFFTAVILFFGVGSAMLWVQHRADERAEARVEENRAWLRAHDEEALAATEAARAATPAPAVREPAAAATPILLLAGPKTPRSTPTAAAQNAEIERKYGAR